MNNTDKQLLIDAAKAAGYPVPEPVGAYPISGFKKDGTFYWNYGEDFSRERTWNPLEKDADAFRLMVDLNLNIDISDQRVYSIGENENASIFVECGSDKNAATRRAVVMAAADNFRSAK